MILVHLSSAFHTSKVIIFDIGPSIKLFLLMSAILTAVSASYDQQAEA